MKASYPRKGKIGALVRLRKRVRSGPQTARIISRLVWADGGVELDRRLDCFRYWNVSDLEYVNDVAHSRHHR